MTEFNIFQAFMQCQQHPIVKSCITNVEDYTSALELAIVKLIKQERNGDEK